MWLIFQAYEKQVKDLEKKNKKLEEEKDLMSLDVDARYIWVAAWQNQ